MKPTMKIEDLINKELKAYQKVNKPFVKDIKKARKMWDKILKKHKLI